MQLKLRVLKGKNAGKEIPVHRQQFIIGRGEDCQLRPHSDLISRKHCELRLTEEGAFVRDLGSKNGTVVNGEPLKAEHQLKTGDTVGVGPLEFEVHVEIELGGQKRPKADSVQEVAARSASGPFADDDIGSWLDEADQADRERRRYDPETRQFQVGQIIRSQTEETKEQEAVSEKDDKKKKKEYGKLPPPPKSVSASSRDAAAETLKKFFTQQ